MMISKRLKRRSRRFCKSAHGAAAVELAIVLPVLLLLVIGVVDYGRVYYQSVIVSNAARAGAEWGAQGPSTSGDTVDMRKFANLDGAEAAPFQINARRYCRCYDVADLSCGACGDASAPSVFIEVTATDTLTTFIPYPGLPRKVVIRRMATFRSQ